MKKPKQNWNKAGGIAFVLAGMGLATYLGSLLRESLPLQYAGDPQELAGFMRWLLGYVVLFAGLCALGWINYRGPFRWLAGPQYRWHYRTWLLALYGGLFELLQWRTAHDLEVVEENLLVAGLCLAFVAAFTLMLDTVRARRERLMLLQQKTAAELDSLRAQLNPHFLFNSLNTLYSEAIQQGQDKLSQHIAELSGILRFTLQQARHDTVPISEEIAFLQRYINLQQARLPNNPQRRIEVRFHWDQQPAAIAPLLLLPFVENAFQYGLHPTRPCFITIQLDVENSQVRLRVENSIVRPQLYQGAGLGIVNTRRRLDRLYPRRYWLEAREEGEVFMVELGIKGSDKP